MAEQPWTIPSDVRDRWIGDEPLSASDTQIGTLIGDAEDLILSEFADLPDRIDAEGGVPLARVKRVVARVVMRHLRNPEGIRQQQEGAGPYQRSTTYGGNEPGALYLTDEDRAALGGSLSGAAFTIDQTPTTTAPLGPSGWLDYGGTYFL
jgi:hypothetical protein